MGKKDKIFSLSIQDLKDLGIIKSKTKRKKRNKRKTFRNTNEYQMGGVKSDSSHMVGYSNSFNPQVNQRNDVEYQVEKIIQNKGLVAPDKKTEQNIPMLEYKQNDIPTIRQNVEDENKFRNFVTTEQALQYRDEIAEKLKNINNKINNKSTVNVSDNNGYFGNGGGSDTFRQEGEPQPFISPSPVKPEQLFLEDYDIDTLFSNENNKQDNYEDIEEAPQEIIKPTIEELETMLNSHSMKIKKLKKDEALELHKKIYEYKGGKPKKKNLLLNRQQLHNLNKKKIEYLKQNNN
jgi:hypothetical protein